MSSHHEDVSPSQAEERAEAPAELVAPEPMASTPTRSSLPTATVPATEATPAGKVVLEGRVVDRAYASTEAVPARGAGVVELPKRNFLSEEGRPWATTGDVGAFRLEVDDPGTRPLELRLVTEEDDVHRQAELTVQLEEGERRRSGIVIERFAHGPLLGRTIDVAGRAVPDIEVTLETWDPTGSFHVPLASVRSDTEGRFRFASVREFVGLSVTKPGYVLLEALRPERVEGGGWEQLDVVLGGSAELRVRIVGPAGEPFPGVDVAVRPGGPCARPGPSSGSPIPRTRRVSYNPGARSSPRPGFAAMFRAPRGLLLPLAPAVLLAGTAAAQTYPVSGPFTPFLASDVEDFALTPDGSRAVYAADERKIGVLELFSVPAGGGPTLRLNQDLQAGQLLRDFEVSPDGEWVVYHVSDTTSETLWAARVGAEGTAVLLGGNAGKVPGDFQIGPNSRYVVYRDEFQTRLFSVPIDASRARVRLDPQLGPVTSFAFTADGSRVVYQVRTARLQLFSVPVDGSSVSVSLDDSVATWHTYLIGLHQDRAYFRDVATDAFYAVPVDGAAPPVTLATGTGQPVYCKLSPDGSTIVSLVDKVGLHAVATDGSTPLPVSLAEGFVRGDFLFTSDGDRVVYRRLVGGDADLFAVRLSDERVVRLTSGFHAWEIHDGSITPDGAFAVFEHLVDTVTYPRVYDLYSVAIEGGAVPRKLNGPLVPGETVLTGEDLGFRISADGARVTYIAAQEVGAGYQLFAAPVAGGAPATLLDGGPRPNRTVTSLVASPVDEEVYFVADEELPTAQELFRVPADGSAPASRVSTALMGTNRGDVREFQLSPDESRVVYLADQDLDDRVELYSARTDGSGEAIRLNGPLPFGHDVLDFRITPDSEHVAFSTGGTFLGPLFGVPIDGGRPPSLLTPSYRLSYPYFPSPDGEVIVFPGPFFDFFAVPVDGSGPPVQISDGGAGGSLLFVNTTRLFPDGRGVVHRGPNRTGMVAAPLDGSAPPIELTGSTRKGAGDFHLTEDDDLLFIQEDGRFDLDLFLVPVDGSQAVVQVSDPAVDGRTRSLPFEHVPIADRVVYQKDDGLFMRPLDLGVPPVRLSPPGAGVYEWAVGPRGRRVAYSSGTDLFVTPITHSDPVGVSEPFGRFLGVTELAFTADGRRILFLGKRNSSTHLYVAPTGTAGGAIRLDRETNVFAFDLRPDSDRVVYLGERTQGKVQVYEVPVDGHRRRNRVSKRPAGLAPPVLSSEASAVLYLGTDVLAGYLDLLVHRFGPGAFTWSPEPR